MRLLRRFESATDRHKTDRGEDGLLLQVARVFGVPIEEIILPDDQVPIDADRIRVVMKGWPGVGKSTLASLLALDGEDVPSVFPDGVLWISLGRDPDLESCSKTWYRAVEDSTGEALNETKIGARDYLKKHLHGRRVLLVIDDAWEVDHAGRFDVGGRSCATLITTRLNSVALDLAGNEEEDVFELKVLDDESAFALFKSLAPGVAKAHEEESRELVKDLEGLPLAIQVAGRLLNVKSHVGLDIRTLIGSIRAKRNEWILDKDVPANMRDLASGTNWTVAALLEQSTRHLSEQARNYYVFLGQQAPKPATFTQDDVVGLWGMDSFDEAAPIVEEILGVGLIQRADDPEPGRRQRGPSPIRYYMHALLVALARSLASR